MKNAISAFPAAVGIAVRLTSLALAATISGCGQGPSFHEQVKSHGSQLTGGDSHNGSADAASGGLPGSVENGSGSGDNGQASASGEGDQEVLLPGDGAGGEWSPDWADGKENAGDNGAARPAEGPVEVPGATGSDLDALHQCLANWKNHPFTTPVQNYRKISASVSVGGIGNLVNDTERTDEPFLTLIDAGVNVLGSPTYRLLNPNGYYCMKVNVNVMTSFSINLHCKARLADSRVNVNVGSSQDDVTSAVGVHVLSTVTVNSVRPEGDQCIR